MGDVIAGHRIEAELGRGGMGVVYRARHLALGRDRALKLLPTGLSHDEAFRARFRRESRIAASLEHPNVVPVHEAGEHEGRLYLSMRLVEGRDLRQLVATEGPLSPDAALRVVRAVASALDESHAAGLVHRDVKPANIMIGEGVDAGRVYLADFGISRAPGDSSVTAPGEIVGTAAYLAPEQISGEPVDRRADVYASGAVLYFALTGMPPFRRDSEVAVLFAHGNAPRPRPTVPRPELPASMDIVVARAMAVAPAERYGSAGEFADDFAKALGDEATVRTAPPRPVAARRRTWIAAVLALAGAAAVFLALSRDDELPDPSGSHATRDTAPLERVASIRMPGEPKGLDVDGDRLWVANVGTATLGTANVASNRARLPVEVGGQTSSVAAGFGYVWATGPGRHLIRLDPATGAYERIDVGIDPSDVAVDAEWVWVAVEGADEVVRLNPASGAVDARVVVGDGPRSLAVGDGIVWAANIEDGTLTKVDAESARKVASSIEVGSRPADVAVGEGAVWVVNVDGGDLVRVDPGRNVSSRPSVDPPVLDDLELPRAVKAGLGSVWVVTAADSRLHQIDPESLRRADSLRVGARPADVGIGSGSVWTADEGGSSVTRVVPGQSP